MRPPLLAQVGDGRSPSRGSDRLTGVGGSVSSTGSLSSDQPSSSPYRAQTLGGPPDLRRRSSSVASAHRHSTPSVSGPAFMPP